MLDRVRALYAYSAWANNRILDTAARLSREQYLAEHDGAGSIRGILVHTASAQWTWLERWRGSSPAALWDARTFPDLETLRTHWAGVEAASTDYIAGLRQGDLDAVVSYVNFRGESWSYPLWQQMVHQVNHATQHRSEAALLLTQAGHSPGDLDFLRYFDGLGEGR